jgi:hypothetical protein
MDRTAVSIEGLLNGTLSVSAGCSLFELMFDSSSPDFIEKILKESSEQNYRPLACREVSRSMPQAGEGGSETEQMEQNCISNLELQLGDIFLAKCQAVSDGIAKNL